jgi:hypothetical protein
VRGLLDVGGAGRNFATNVAANGAAADRTIVQSVIPVAVVFQPPLQRFLMLSSTSIIMGTAFARSLPLPLSLPLPPR